MKERPILFSGEMVRAILDGRKTQTRRVIKPQPADGWINWLIETYGGRLYDCQGQKRLFICGENGKEVNCPHGQPGDRLWVRETWRPLVCAQHDEGQPPSRDRPCRCNQAEYRAGNENLPGKWRPSIFMPRWASRITLEVTGVRVERLRDISEADCCAELGTMVEWPGPGPEPYRRDLRGCFSRLWDSINAKRGLLVGV